jgi:DNA-binding IclR family transcriptional regulator
MNDIYVKDDDGGSMKRITITEALLEFVKHKTPPAMSSKQISEEMGIPYTTIHHRLVKLAESGKIKKQEDRSYKPGRKALLWEKI